jgi:GntR family transcriptional repressor for pyruvate dehydrogenase complex
MVKIKPVKRQSLVDDVVDRIRAVIVEGHFRPGDRLPTEAELGKQLQVSRTVLREAMGRLEILGLVSVQGPRGMFVSEPAGLRHSVNLLRSALLLSPRELVKFTEFRRALECESARGAAERATPEEIAELEVMCQEIRRGDLPAADAYRLDFRFHQKLAQITGNEVMQNVMDVVREFVMASIVEGAVTRRRDPEITFRGHMAIVDAIAAHDADGAEKAMRDHMNSVLDSLRDQVKRQEREQKQLSAG